MSSIFIIKKSLWQVVDPNLTTEEMYLILQHHSYINHYWFVVQLKGLSGSYSSVKVEQIQRAFFTLDYSSGQLIDYSSHCVMSNFPCNSDAGKLYTCCWAPAQITAEH